MHEAAVVLWDESALDGETRKTSESDDGLIHPKPGSQTLYRSEFHNTGHENTDTSTCCETGHGTESEDLRVCCTRVYFEGEPEGEKEEGIEEGHDRDGVEASEAVGEVGGEDAADD